MKSLSSDPGHTTARSLAVIFLFLFLSGCSSISSLLQRDKTEGCTGPGCNGENLAMSDSKAGTHYCYSTAVRGWQCSKEEDPSLIGAVSDLPMRGTPAASQMPSTLSGQATTQQPKPVLAPEAVLAPSTVAQIATVTRPSQPQPTQTLTMSLTELLQQPAEFYAVQLLARREENAVIDYAARNGLADPLYARIRSQNSDWFVLLLGTFPDRDAAELAKQAWVRSKTLKVEPWVRQLGPLQNAIKSAQGGA